MNSTNAQLVNTQAIDPESIATPLRGYVTGHHDRASPVFRRR
jgi:hypothetical protein